MSMQFIIIYGEQHELACTVHLSNLRVTLVPDQLITTTPYRSRVIAVPLIRKVTVRVETMLWSGTRVDRKRHLNL